MLKVYNNLIYFPPEQSFEILPRCKELFIPTDVQKWVNLKKWIKSTDSLILFQEWIGYLKNYWNLGMWSHLYLIFFLWFFLSNYEVLKKYISESTNCFYKYIYVYHIYSNYCIRRLKNFNDKVFQLIKSNYYYQMSNYFLFFYFYSKSKLFFSRWIFFFQIN